MRFFSSAQISKPCGMFSLGHLFLLVISISFIAAALHFSKNADIDVVRKIILVLTVFLWVLEIIKIVFNLKVNEIGNINNYVPLYYCSLVLYCGFMSVFGRGIVKRCGDVFLGVGAFTGGAAFLLFPSTSLTMYPVFHYISIQSMIYHSVMVYIGILVIRNGYTKLRISDFIYYSLVVLAAGSAAIIINRLFGSNLMFLSDNFPGTPIEILYNLCGPFFSLTMLLIHILIPFWCVYGFISLVFKKSYSDMKYSEVQL